MLHRIKNAQKIARLEGWEIKLVNMLSTDSLAQDYYLEKINNRERGDYYERFDGLMEIVEGVNKDRTTLYTIAITHNTVDVMNFKTGSLQMFYYDETQLIDALQDAILFYFENKEKKDDDR